MSGIFCWKCGQSAHLKVEILEMSQCNGRVKLEDEKITLIHNEESECDNTSPDVNTNESLS